MIGTPDHRVPSRLEPDAARQRPRKRCHVELAILVRGAAAAWIACNDDGGRICWRPGQVHRRDAALIGVRHVVKRARTRAQHARELPAVDDGADGAAHGRRRVHDRQLPDGVHLQDVPRRPHVLVQFLVLRLIGPDCERAVGIVLEPQRRLRTAKRPDIAVVGERKRIAATECKSSAEPAAPRRLDRVEGLVELRQIHSDRPEPAVRPQKICRECGRTRRRARRQRRILIARGKRRPNVRRIDVDLHLTANLGQAMVTVLADIRDVQQR